VDRSVHFLQRLFERGPRFVSPAEFPHLVPSAPSGNASIYLGLTGPVVGVSELEASAESSFAVAVSFLELGIAEAMIAGGAEPQDPVVDRVLAPLHVEAAVPASGRPGGAAWLLLEADSGGAALAEVALLTEAPSGSRLELASEPQSGAVVLSGLPPEVLDSVLAGSGWALAPRKTLHAALGRAEARGGYELAAAAALVARGDAPEVLVVGGARGWAFATLLRKHVAKGP
jgi:3-oxoacyl-[acyl-carrier-protein] synthase II